MLVSYSPGKKEPAEDKVVLNVLLNCELTKSSETKQIHFQSLPTTPLEIKKRIEVDLSIPSCVQTLHYQSITLKDSDQLQSTHFRSGDTFTVDYPIEAECEKVQGVIKWLKELSVELSKPHIIPDDSESDPSVYLRIENLILEGERDGTTEALAVSLFFPWEDKKKLINKHYFQQEGGLDMLMTVYGMLVSREWGDLGIEKSLHVYVERKCCQAVVNYAQSLPLSRQVVLLGGLEICTATLLRRQLHKEDITLDHLEYITLRSALIALCNLSELPECQVRLAMETDVIEQILAMARHPAYDCYTAKVSVEVILNLTQCPETHTHIVREEFLESLIEICEQRHKMVSQQSAKTLQGKKEDPMVIKALKFNTGIVLAQVGLGSPRLLVDSIPSHLQQQLLHLFSDIQEAASPADIRQHDKTLWGTFLPYLRYLYKPSTIQSISAEKSSAKGVDIGTKLYIDCCNVLLYGLETVLGGYASHHLEILVKEGLLDYTMCLPAVLPGECQPRARSLVNELCKHRQLQPPSLCTLAKAHVAKTFCGLQPVMEMNSIGEFVYKHFSS